MDWLIIPLLIILAGNNKEAQNKATVAYLKQTGIEEMLQDYQKRQISEGLQVRIGQGAWLVKTAIDQRIALEWRFQ